MNNLIYDRTQTDVARVETLRKRVRNRTATPSEMEEWLSPLKGAYNYTDLNRVGEAIKTLSAILNEYGYKNIIHPKTDWKIGEKPTEAELKKCLMDLKKLRETFYILPTTPQVPTDMLSFNYEEANDIEKILFDISENIEKLEMVFVRCGVPNFGQERVWQQRFRRPSSWAGLQYDLSKYNQKWETVTSPSEEVGVFPTSAREKVSNTINSWNEFISEIDKTTGVIE